ncbi:hypothetical protein K445DRAFT_309623, partial [Daldinia sp. EC12]
MDKDTNTNLGVGAVMAALSIVFVGMRFYVRHLKKAGFKWDDWLILTCLLTMIATDILAICALVGNPSSPEAATLENDTFEYTPADVKYTKLSYIATVLYFTIASTMKMSILLMYNRLFSVSKSFRHQVVALFGLVISFWVGCTIANLLNCIPIKYTWINSLADPEYCINYNIYWFASGIIETFIDVLIIILPIRMVIGLQFNWHQKVAVASVFLVIVSGLLKAILGYVPGSREPSFIRTQLWTTVHCGTGIICACLPVCWPLISHFGKFVPKRWSRITSFQRLRDTFNSGSIEREE